MKENHLRSYKIPTSAELQKGTSVNNGSHSEIQAHDRFVRTGSAHTPPQLTRAKPLPAHGERMTESKLFWLVPIGERGGGVGANLCSIVPWIYTQKVSERSELMSYWYF